ncbi:MAG TPA: sensor domain-containing diguanylate cyclase [Terracidiphilus sp.]|nr:sensor domain-containing diguanylate cyclase [Terracidiphilus sp.]
MAERVELLEAALDSRPDGIALFGKDDAVVFWNRAAEAITGYAAAEVLAQTIPDPLAPLLENTALQEALPQGPQPRRGMLVRAKHKFGHCFDAIARRVLLRDALGERIGTAVVFHPAASLEALPHGEMPEGERLEENQADFEERLQEEFEDSEQGGAPFGVLWINVDQAHELHRTHGVAACYAMLTKVRYALAQGMRPVDEIGRWGADEFLIVAHERSDEMLAAHGQSLAGLARTADFRWWGDRVSLTVSIGVAQFRNGSGETLAQLLERARQAMQTSAAMGGNRVTASAPIVSAQGALTQDENGCGEPNESRAAAGGE